MKIFFLIIALVVFNGCDDNENNESSALDKDPLKDPLRLFTSDKYNPKNEFEKNLSKVDYEMFIRYIDIQIIKEASCIYFQDEKIQKTLEELIFDNLENEKKGCDIFNEIDEKYYYLYEETINNKKAPETLFSFEFMQMGEAKVAGLFPTIEECNIYREKIEDTDMFINKCKKYKSILKELGIDPEDPLGILDNGKD